MRLPDRPATVGADAPRVLLVVKGLDIGGIERMVVDIALGLAARKTDVEVAVVNSRRDRLIPQLEKESVVVRRLDGSDRIGFRGVWGLSRLVRSGRFDVIHVHGPLPSVVVRLVARRRAIVTTSHTLWSGLRWPTRLMWRATASRDAATVAVSAAVAASLPAGASERAIVIPHGLDHDSMRAALDVGPVVSINETEPSAQIIVVASHRDVKNYPNLLQAIRIALDLGARVRVKAVGEGPDLPRHRQLAADLGLHDVIEFLPPVENVLPLIAAADFLVVASDFEGQPLVVLEALALGVPVVATAVGRIPELVGPSVGRVVRPGDPTVLGAAINELATDPTLLQSMADEARRTSGGWTLDDVVDAHLLLYRELSSRRDRLGPPASPRGGGT